MNKKIKSAAIRALWTMFQTAVGFVVANASTPMNLDTTKILIASLTAGLVSFAKSMGIGMPETEGLATDGELELIGDGTNGIATGGLKWNPDFDLSERIASSDNPAIVLGIKKTIHLSEDAHRQLRV